MFFKCPLVCDQLNPLFPREAVVVIAFGTAVDVLAQFIGMNELRTAGTLDPTAKSILFGGLDFNLRFIARKESHNLRT
jgi:hypothetical protein